MPPEPGTGVHARQYGRQAKWQVLPLSHSPSQSTQQCPRKLGPLPSHIMKPQVQWRGPFRGKHPTQRRCASISRTKQSPPILYSPRIPPRGASSTRRVERIGPALCHPNAACSLDPLLGCLTGFNTWTSHTVRVMQTVSGAEGTHKSGYGCCWPHGSLVLRCCGIRNILTVGRPAATSLPRLLFGPPYSFTATF
jgi:hypothetical protein